MAMRTYYSFTGDETYDTLVIGYIAIRIIWCIGIIVTCLTQLGYEIKYQARQNLINPRSMTLLGLTCFAIFRIFYSAFLLETNDDTTGSICDYLGMWSLFFEMWCWAFIGTYFKPMYHRRVWKVTWSIIGLYIVYEVTYSILATYAKDWAPTFFTAGFLFLLVLLGVVCFCGSFFLHRQIQHKKNLLTGKVANLIGRIKVFSVLIICILVLNLSRDLLFYVILQVKLTDPLTHFSNMLTMLFECSTATIMMVAVAECPINYITFESISPSLISGKYGSSDSSSSSRENTTSSLSDKAGSSSSPLKQWHKKPREPNTQQSQIKLGRLINSNSNTNIINQSIQDDHHSLDITTSFDISTSSNFFPNNDILVKEENEESNNNNNNNNSCLDV
ncbi:hypothetical protein DFA_07414 [Cavenderia fasciculata]|uniref:THH1/TOM1/TOM3 domain-containing protein n=1 Tax=Cavenderia fasciculata TaxID=261658 RepID=F4PWC7_CACFS|nr:uncharacterized protein DFA_07414 [Cavenderia fasciculata]EGG20291.1 hypothetical protein DFA_07414 [Cavenderia fasciculata]|eukprot:XP_004367274.1 hypothetical protein DFA_07414 [Cavenderia fasciculata]